MKRILSLITIVAAFIFAMPARAQYVEIANQLPGLLGPALSGSMKYKGYVELNGLTGIGTNRAHMAGISTSQGFQYASWFFMGAGIGVDVLRATGYVSEPPSNQYPYSYSRTKAMIPVFTDFRFTIGNQKATSFYADVKLGAAWILGNSYLRMNTGSLSSNTQFMAQPSVGVRVPINQQNSRQAFNIGVTYRLLTSNNNYGWHDNSVTLNNLGLTVGYEW